MGEFLPLEALGPRIMICGPSNSGKSTLCVALSNKLGFEAFYVDLFRHLPETNWVQRSDEEFRALHDQAITLDKWVMDGNYPRLMPQRIARATGIIMLGSGRWANFRRYLWRTLFEKRQRAGSLAGDTDSVKWEMVQWILWTQPKQRQGDLDRVRAAGLPLLELGSMGELRRLYAAWGLALPRQSVDGRQ